MTPGRPPIHPDAATLHRFVLGQSPGDEAERVEQHLRECDACARVSESLPGDRLLDLLRRREPHSSAPGRGSLAGREQEDPAMARQDRRAAGLRRFFGLGLMVGALTITGCDSSVGSVKLKGPAPDGKGFGQSPVPTPGTPPVPVKPKPGRKAPEFRPG